MIPNRLQPDTSLADNLALINQNFDILDDQDRTKIIYDGSTPKLLFGYQSGGFGTASYGLKIAKDGFDVTTAADSDLSFSSALNTLKVVLTGTTSITKPANSTGASVVVTHSLGYIPVHISYYDSGLGYIPITQPGVNSSTGAIDAFIQSAATSTTLQFDYLTPTGSPYYSQVLTTTIRYYLLRETAN